MIIGDKILRRNLKSMEIVSIGEAVTQQAIGKGSKNIKKVSSSIAMFEPSTIATAMNRGFELED